MPAVPYTPFSTAEPSGGAERVNVATPGAAFGENVAGAIQHLGATGEQVGGELFQRAIALQDLKNEADARSTTTDFMEQQGLSQAKFDALEGKAKVDALPGHISDTKALLQQYRGKLQTPIAQKMFDQEAQSFTARNIIQSATQAGQANKQYVTATAQAQADLVAHTFVNPTDKDEYDSKIQTIKSAGETIAGANNWSQPQLDDWTFKQTSAQRKAQITQVAQKDPQLAMTMLDEHKTDMRQEDYDATANVVKAQNRAVGSAVLSNQIYDPKKPLAVMEQEVKDASPTLAHDDPLFEKDAVATLRTKYNQDRFATQREDDTNKQTVLEAIGSNQYKDVREMRADPQLAAAIDALPPSQFKNGLQGQLNSHWDQQNKNTNEANYHELLFQAGTDPQAFLKRDDMYSLQMSDSQRSQLLSKRAQLIKAPIDDPHITQALTQMRNTHGSELDALGIRLRTVGNADEYDRYGGALQQAVDAFIEVNKRPPSPKEVSEDIGPQVIRQVAQPRLGGWFGTSHTPVYDLPVPDEVKQSLVKDAQEQGIDAPTEEEMRQAYLREQFKQFYANEKPSGAK
jgi:hypothetical protein